MLTAIVVTPSELLPFVPDESVFREIADPKVVAVVDVERMLVKLVVWHSN